ncbi:Integrase [Janthinobacterium sp. CG23_2]|nr:Integrase [Janthinobacterium sp. CG23_2]CUU28019.1 Integrase [Janthinobacterium sp. CG23_2]
MTKICDKDEENAVPMHLYRREDGRSWNYYVRLTAPTAIQHLLNKKDHSFRCSTGTADLHRAKVIGAEIVAKKRREWHDLRELAAQPEVSVSTPLTKSLIQQICGARLNSWLHTDNKERYGDVGLDDEVLREIEALCKHTDAGMRSILAQGRASSRWADVVEEVDDWGLTLGYKLEPTDPLFPALIRAFAQSEKSAHEFIAARNNGEQPAERSMVPQAGTCLSAMNDEFIAYKSKLVGPKPLSMAISIWNKFIDFKGDVLLDEVTSNDVYKFFEYKLFSAPEKWSQKYVDGHVKRALRQMFSLARTKALMTGDNPVAKVELMPKLAEAERKKRENPRFPFSRDHINTLFESEWYVPRSTQFRGKLGSDLAARYFGPLIGLLHGMRVREFLQLMTSDILPVDGVLCFKFQVEMPSNDHQAELLVIAKAAQIKAVTELPQRSVKNDSVLRTIPVHPKLIELGFLEYVEQRRKSRGAPVPLFASSVPTPGGKAPTWGRAFEQSFLRYVRDTLRFGKGFGSHSFRHLFEDRIRQAQALAVWPAGISQMLSGRRLTRDKDREFFRELGSEQEYGNGYLPSALLPYLEKLSFDDMKFPAGFSQWVK